VINIHRNEQFKRYNFARNHLITNPDCLIELENSLTFELISLLELNIFEIVRDYNEASYLFPFWENYPPEDRGRDPIRDQYPWIEVGEHAIGSKLPRLLNQKFQIRDSGFPTGTDQRFLLTSDTIGAATRGLTNSAWFFIDIKSVGPRDDQNHTVMSHNQISGNGNWKVSDKGVENSVIQATGTRTSHNFYPSLPPLVILSDGTIAPIVILALKPVYQMLKASSTNTRNDGQPLARLDIVCIPNGLLLTQNPNYLEQYNGLLFPGKDDKSKDPRKLRARVSFEILTQIAAWRVHSIDIPSF
jgi:hypothetical protein